MFSLLEMGVHSPHVRNIKQEIEHCWGPNMFLALLVSMHIFVALLLSNNFSLPTCCCMGLFASCRNCRCHSCRHALSARQLARLGAENKLAGAGAAEALAMCGCIWRVQRCDLRRALDAIQTSPTSLNLACYAN